MPLLSRQHTEAVTWKKGLARAQAPRAAAIAATVAVRRREDSAMAAMKHWCSMLALLLFAGTTAAQEPRADNKTFIMKLATATLNDGQHEWMKRFAAAIERKSGGRIKAELYPASQLGSIPRMIEGTQLGSIQIFVGPPEFFVGVDQRFELMSASGLFRLRRMPSRSRTIRNSPRPSSRSAPTRA
jgi:hypothetical protein